MCILTETEGATTTTTKAFFTIYTDIQILGKDRINLDLVSSKVINEIFQRTGISYSLQQQFTFKTTEHPLLMLDSTVSCRMEVQEAGLQIVKKVS